MTNLFQSPYQLLISSYLPISRARLCKGRITLSKGKIAIQRISDGKRYGGFDRIEMYPADSAIRPWNNPTLLPEQFCQRQSVKFDAHHVMRGNLKLQEQF